MEIAAKKHGRHSRGRKSQQFILHLIMIFLAISCVYPFLVIVGSSFASQASLNDFGFSVIPKDFSLEAYRAVLQNPKRLVDAYWVTIVTTVVATIGGLILISTFGYVISRRDYRYKNILSFYIFFTMLFNGGLVPTYILVSKWLGMQNSLWALILPGMCGAWNVMLMKGFFQTIPVSLIESAKIDGAGELRIFSQIIIPLSKPGFATIGLLLLLGGWNEWYRSLLYITSENKVKLQYLLMVLMRNVEFLNSAEATQMVNANVSVNVPTQSVRMVMCFLAMGPIIVIFPFFQKYFVKGLTVGSIKG